MLSKTLKSCALALGFLAFTACDTVAIYDEHPRRYYHDHHYYRDYDHHRHHGDRHRHRHHNDGGSFRLEIDD